jgi:hypothetical protein
MLILSSVRIVGGEMVEETPAGMDRRQLLRRGALLGGALAWTAPVVQSISPAAFADGSPPTGGGGAPSYTMLVMRCGTSYQSLKIGQDGSAECGVSGGNGHSQRHAKQMIDAQLATAAPGVTWASLVGDTCVLPDLDVTPAGLRVTHPGCTIVAWAVHDGAGNGCGQVSFGPANRGLPAYSPTIGSASSLFPKPQVTTCPSPPA